MNPGSPTCAECGEPMRLTPGEPPYCPRCVNLGIKASDGKDLGFVDAGPRRSSAGPNPLFKGYDEVEDDKPYVVTGEPAQEPCLNCRKPLPLGALVCNHCGFNQQTGETLERVYKKVDKEWEEGMPFQTRLKLFLTMTGLAALGSLVVGIADGGVVGLLISWLIGAALWAFVVGTYPRVNVTRSKVGHVRIAKTWRCCFIPLRSTDIRWRGHVGVAVSASDQTDFWDWVILFFLTPWGVIPAVLWWYYAVKPNQLDVALTKEHGYPAILLYRGRDQAKANDIANTIRTVTGWS